MAGVMMDCWVHFWVDCVALVLCDACRAIGLPASPAVLSQHTMHVCLLTFLQHVKPACSHSCSILRCVVYRKYAYRTCYMYDDRHMHVHTCCQAARLNQLGQAIGFAFTVDSERRPSAK